MDCKEGTNSSILVKNVGVVKMLVIQHIFLGECTVVNLPFFGI